MAVPQRIQRLLDGHQLEQVTQDLEKVVAYWNKALAASRDCRKDLAPDNAVTLGYQAALQAATAVLESAGYRVRGQTGGHHYTTFYALTALGHAGLESADVRSESVRKMRKKSFYDTQEATPEQARVLMEWLDELLPAAHSALGLKNPELRSRLRVP